MNKNSVHFFITIGLVLCCLGIVESAYSMGLRSLVALPVEKGGTVVRISIERAKKADIDTLVTSVAYGFSAKQTLLFALPYRLSPAGGNRQGNLSMLYRHIAWKKDSLSGTKRLGLLGGILLPTKNDKDAAVQTGFVFTHFNNKNEIDFDILYQAGMNNRIDSGHYDLSWQYRLLPSEPQDWGLSKELNSVLELNGRWREGNSITHQVTAGFQWISPKWVFEGGITKAINNNNELRYLLSTRFHF